MKLLDLRFFADEAFYDFNHIKYKARLEFKKFTIDLTIEKNYSNSKLLFTLKRGSKIPTFLVLYGLDAYRVMHNYESFVNMFVGFVCNNLTTRQLGSHCRMTFHRYKDLL